MNKITTILAGVALAAAVATPASAAGVFSNTTPQPFPAYAFSGVGSTYTLTSVPVNFANFSTGAIKSGTLTLSGGTLKAGTTYTYTNTTFTFTPTSGPVYTDKGTTIVSVDSTTGIPSFSTASPGGTTKNNNLSLTYTPVPEASTVVSFGALLALGGLAVLRRKSVARAS